MERDRDMARLLQSTTIEPDIKGSKADFGPQYEEVADNTKKKKKKSGFRRTFQKNIVASSKNLLSSRDLIKSYEDESQDPSRERTSSAEDSSEEESYESEDSSEESYESEEEGSKEESDESSEEGLSIT
jgi:hypothetical protein